jgi:hypothetical protein
MGQPPHAVAAVVVDFVVIFFIAAAVNSAGDTYGWPERVFRFCEGSARSLYEPFDFPVSAISSAVQLYSQQPAENFSTTPNHFHALEMATLAFKPYTYVPTPPRSKSTATRRGPAPEQVSILDKLQQIRSSSALLSTPRPAAAAATVRSHNRNKDGLALLLYINEVKEQLGLNYLQNSCKKKAYLHEMFERLKLSCFTSGGMRRSYTNRDLLRMRLINDK